MRRENLSRRYPFIATWDTWMREYARPTSFRGDWEGYTLSVEVGYECSLNNIPLKGIPVLIKGELREVVVEELVGDTSQWADEGFRAYWAKKTILKRDKDRVVIKEASFKEVEEWALSYLADIIEVKTQKHLTEKKNIRNLIMENAEEWKPTIDYIKSELLQHDIFEVSEIYALF